MANREQLAILSRGVAGWNAWRAANPNLRPDLRKAPLENLDLAGEDFRRCDLPGAQLSGANLERSNLAKAFLEEADLSNVNLKSSDLSWADLYSINWERADLKGAILRGSKISWALLNEVALDNTVLEQTILANVDFSDATGIDQIIFRGPCMIDLRTLQMSPQLPISFLRGVGLPDNLIDYLPSLLNQPIQFYSCFISYSSRDQAFAERLHSDLQSKGVRCWYAPEDLKIGDRLAEAIDMAIRLRDKVLLILSETSVASAWVLKEVRTALAEEGQHGRTVLFPVRIDDAVMDTTEQWAHDIRRTRHIGDFTRWKDHDAYQKSLERLLRDLRVESAAARPST